MKTFVIGDVHGRSHQLDSLIEMIPRSPDDSLILLGDLIDRGPDAPAVVERVVELCAGEPDKVRCLRGNHEQMLLDFLDHGAALWLSQVSGGEKTFEQYTGGPLSISSVADFNDARDTLREYIPEKHLNFIRGLKLFHEDEYAVYVHAGLEMGKHPSETDSKYLLWARDQEFFRHYKDKPCIFGHTPTVFLPLLGRIGRHGIYISHSAVGIDTGYNLNSPLTCLSLPDFTLYQTYADGRSDTHQITAFIPEELRQMQRKSDSEAVTLA
jgi:serine/threonine protein phosphatase 1